MFAIAEIALRPCPPDPLPSVARGQKMLNILIDILNDCVQYTEM